MKLCLCDNNYNQNWMRWSRQPENTWGVGRASETKKSASCVNWVEVVSLRWWAVKPPWRSHMSRMHFGRLIMEMFERCCQDCFLFVRRNRNSFEMWRKWKCLLQWINWHISWTTPRRFLSSCLFSSSPWLVNDDHILQSNGKKYLNRLRFFCAAFCEVFAVFQSSEKGLRCALLIAVWLNKDKWQMSNSIEWILLFHFDEKSTCSVFVVCLMYVHVADNKGG